jgi:hypothetical protein
VPDDIEHVLHLKGDFAILKSAIKRCAKVRADIVLKINNIHLFLGISVGEYFLCWPSSLANKNISVHSSL